MRCPDASGASIAATWAAATSTNVDDRDIQARHAGQCAGEHPLEELVGSGDLRPMTGPHHRDREEGDQLQAAPLGLTNSQAARSERILLRP